MEEFLHQEGLWSYPAIFFAIVATGLGFPMPEELPVVVAGALVGGGKAIGWIMLPVCIAAVILGDGCLYGIGRVWGRKLIQLSFIRKRLLTPDRLESISANFEKYGVKILLFARLTPGIRTPIFLTAGITRLPLTKFLLADGLYAIPGVSLLFFLGYWFTDSMVDLIENDTYVRPILVLVSLAALAAYLLYRILRRPVVTGNPHEMPPVVEQVAEKITRTPPEAPAASPAVSSNSAVSNGHNGPPRPPAPGTSTESAAGKQAG